MTGNKYNSAVCQTTYETPRLDVHAASSGGKEEIGCC